MAYVPRESLYTRVERLVRDRKAMALFILGFVYGMIRLAGFCLSSGVYWPLALGLGIGIVAVLYARRQARLREEAGMASRALTFYPIPRSRWPQLDEAIAGYRALTGEASIGLGYLRSVDVGDRVDADVSYVNREPDADGIRRVVSPFGAPQDAEPMYVFDERMLDTYTAAELLAVVLHLKYRLEFAGGESARLANGVCEADSKALLLMRDHAALLRAIEKSTRKRETAAPGMGVIRFADNEVCAAGVSDAGIVRKWLVQDRATALRTHLGAMAFDVPTAG
ncbi:MAG: hypothetical protein HGA39_09180 [Coriobacteriia bacterium]|nr:hypothetical protein [Coriobacteriia bacterium]